MIRKAKNRFGFEKKQGKLHNILQNIILPDHLRVTNEQTQHAKQLMI